MSNISITYYAHQEADYNDREEYGNDQGTDFFFQTTEGVGCTDYVAFESPGTVFFAKRTVIDYSETFDGYGTYATPSLHFL